MFVTIKVKLREVINGNMNQNNNNSLFLLEILSNVLQIASYVILQKDSSNNDIMHELQLQDKMLSEQTNIYLKNIIYFFLMFFIN